MVLILELVGSLSPQPVGRVLETNTFQYRWGLFFINKFTSELTELKLAT